jgi:hypothetical protein
VELYGARFQLEFLFRDSKQFTGLSDCQARAAAALDFHCNAALATLNLARTAQLLEQTGESSQVFSMASWKQRQLNERLLDVFIEKLAVATQEPNGIYAQTSSFSRAHSLRIAQPSCSHSLRMCSHSGENNAQTSVPAHIR